MKFKTHIVESGNDSDAKIYQNLHIQKLYFNGDEVEEKHLLKPQETIIFMTNEISLNENELGILFDKKINQERGLLVLATKLVHPGYKGCLSGQIINISKLSIPVRILDKIFEIVKLEDEKRLGHFPNELLKSPEAYQKDLEDISLNYPASFVDIDSVYEKIVAENRRLLNKTSITIFIGIITALGVLIAALTWSLSFIEMKANDRVHTYVSTYEKAETLSRYSISIKEFQNLKNKIKKLEEKVNVQKP